MNQDYSKEIHDQSELLKLNTKLWFAVENNQSEKAKELLDAGATLHKVTGVPLRRYDLEENTPLHIAAKSGFLKLVELLIQYGTKVDIINRLRQTPLQWAAYYGHIEVVKKLVANGANIDAIDIDGDPALTWAANKGQIDVVEYLASQGADCTKVSPAGNTALHWVAISGELKMAEYLIDQGCDVALKNHQGSTAVDLAIENAHSDMVDLLTKYLK